MGQKIVLLGLVEVMNLVDEKHRGLAGALELPGFLDDSLEVLDPGSHRGKIYRDGVGGFGDEARQRGLTAARRAPKYQRAEFAGAQHSAQELAGAEQVLLADELVETRRTHSFSQRLCGGPRLGRRRFEEVHAVMLTQLGGSATGRLIAAFVIPPGMLFYGGLYADFTSRDYERQRESVIYPGSDAAHGAVRELVNLWQAQLQPAGQD